jgi:hypothetical protein
VEGRRAEVSRYHSVVDCWKEAGGSTWLVSWGSQISNKRNSDHSTLPIRCFWSALFEENVCTVIPGQSGRRSRSSRRRFLTYSLMSEVPQLESIPEVLVDGARVSPLDAEAWDVERDMGNDVYARYISGTLTIIGRIAMPPDMSVCLSPKQCQVLLPSLLDEFG